MQDLNAEYLPKTTIVKFLKTVKKFGTSEQKTAASCFINRPHWTIEDKRIITRLFADYDQMTSTSPTLRGNNGRTMEA